MNNNSDPHHAIAISKGISDNEYSLDIKAGSSKKYLLEQLNSDYIKSALTSTLQQKFSSNLLEIDDVIDNKTYHH